MDEIAKAEAAGLQTTTLSLGGGVALSLNTTKAPFNDVRARQALSAALDLNAINDAVENGQGEIPTTLFDKSSPFYADVPLGHVDRARAQKLFDELAAEGRPVDFTMSMYSTGRPLAEAIQTQLSTMRNVRADVRTIDLAQVGQIMADRDYDTLQDGSVFGDPETRLWFSFHGTSRGNTSGIDDPALNAALDHGRTATDVVERRDAYRTVQERLAQLHPFVFYTRAAPTVIASTKLGGVRQYGIGSVLPETLWLQK